MIIYSVHALLVTASSMLADRVVMAMNAVAFIAIAVYSTDLITFYLLYEAASLLVIPVLLTSSRAVRKGFALTSLIYINLIGLISFCLVLSLDMLSSTHQTIDTPRWSIYSLLLLAIIAAKTPTYPLLF